MATAATSREQPMPRPVFGGCWPQRPFDHRRRPHLDSQSYRTLCHIYSACLDFEQEQPREQQQALRIPPRNPDSASCEVSSFKSADAREEQCRKGDASASIEGVKVVCAEDGSKEVEKCKVGKSLCVSDGKFKLPEASLIVPGNIILSDDVGEMTISVQPPSSSFDDEKDGSGGDFSCLDEFGKKEASLKLFDSLPEQSESSRMLIRAIDCVDGCPAGPTVQNSNIDFEKLKSCSTSLLCDEILKSTISVLQEDDIYCEGMQGAEFLDDGASGGMISDHALLIGTTGKEISLIADVSSGRTQNDKIQNHDNISIGCSNEDIHTKHKMETGTEASKELEEAIQTKSFYLTNYFSDKPDTEGKSDGCDDLEEGEIHGDNEDLKFLDAHSNDEAFQNQDKEVNIIKNASLNDHHNRTLVHYDDDLLGKSDGSETDSGDDNDAAELPKIESANGLEASATKKRKRVITEVRKAKKKKAKRIKRAKMEKAQGVKRLKLPPPKPKVVKLCSYYMQGKCTKGSECKFSHDATPETKTKPCTHFARGTCLKGNDCPYDHELSKYPCHNFMTDGTCTRGSNCKFSHEKSVLERSLSMPGCNKTDNSLVQKSGSINKMQATGRTCHAVKRGPGAASASKELSIKDARERKVIEPKGIRFLTFQDGKSDTVNLLPDKPVEEKHQENLMAHLVGNKVAAKFDQNMNRMGNASTSSNSSHASCGISYLKNATTEPALSGGQKNLDNGISDAHKILQEFLYGDSS